ncbi:MAG: LysR family transcriptional regulator [Oscillospiraceae bacterium]|nr:LysR family transcriptional regulator [Oscillospiraceae bacterium]
MELLQLRYFATVARTLNISQAAKHHMIPQPAMSKTISKLEKELGVCLFDRYKNRLSLTNEGKIFYHAVSQSLNAIDDGVTQISNVNAPLKGEINILVLQHRETLVDCIMEFKKRYPQVSFRIFYDRDSAEDFDICIACEQPGDDFGGNVCLITEPLRLVVSAEHPGAKLSSVPFRELEKEEFAVISPDSNLWLQTAIQCREAGFEPKASITCSDLHCLMKYVSTGMAVTLGPEVAWKNLRSDKVAFVPTVPALYRSTYIFWNKLKSASRLQDAFREFTVEYFRALPTAQ